MPKRRLYSGQKPASIIQREAYKMDAFGNRIQALSGDWLEEIITNVKREYNLKLEPNIVSRMIENRINADISLGAKGSQPSTLDMNQINKLVELDLPDADKSIDIEGMRGELPIAKLITAHIVEYLGEKYGHNFDVNIKSPKERHNLLTIENIDKIDAVGRSGLSDIKSQMMVYDNKRPEIGREDRIKKLKVIRDSITEFIGRRNKRDLKGKSEYADKKVDVALALGKDVDEEIRKYESANRISFDKTIIKIDELSSDVNEKVIKYNAIYEELATNKAKESAEVYLATANKEIHKIAIELGKIKARINDLIKGAEKEQCGVEFAQQQLEITAKLCEDAGAMFGVDSLTNVLLFELHYSLLGLNTSRYNVSVFLVELKALLNKVSNFENTYFAPLNKVVDRISSDLTTQTVELKQKNG